MIRSITTALASLAAATLMISCAGEDITNIRTEYDSALLDADGVDEEAAAPMYLTGLGDRICELKFDYVKKKGADFEVVASDKVSDNAARSGFGRGCLNFCIASFDALRKENTKNNVSILVKSCKFSDNADKVAAGIGKPLSPVASKDLADKNRGVCKVVGSAGVIHFMNNALTKAECKAECSSRDATNPHRKCEFKGDVFHKYPKKYCEIKGSGGKLHYGKNVRQFICRSECAARDKTNPQRQCKFGDKVFRPHP